MAAFCKSASRFWPIFDGHPPKPIDREDIGEFFAPNDIIINLEFSSGSTEALSIILPYQALFPLAKATKHLITEQ
jgi:hypothetical protein